mmetsp:Transcript_50708/g.164010  ORF Transcript_50708/g.164010 Transcript_50708/m.164010 type:complete len:84 (+) Transcript_50708:506-757(+)
MADGIAVNEMGEVLVTKCELLDMNSAMEVEGAESENRKATEKIEGTELVGPLGESLGVVSTSRSAAPSASVRADGCTARTRAS